MKEIRYRLRGRTQRKGITEISWHSMFVVARNIEHAHADNSSQRAIMLMPGRKARPADSLRGLSFFSIADFSIYLLERADVMPIAEKAV
jgi:hypothetical protein